MKERPLSELLGELDDLAHQKAEWNERARVFLRSAREVADLSQTELAAAAGVTQSYVSQIENGARSVSSETLNAFSSALEAKAKEGDTHGHQDHIFEGKAAARKARKGRASK